MIPDAIPPAHSATPTMRRTMRALETDVRRKGIFPFAITHLPCLECYLLTRWISKLPPTGTVLLISAPRVAAQRQLPPLTKRFPGPLAPIYSRNNIEVRAPARQPCRYGGSAAFLARRLQVQKGSSPGTLCRASFCCRSQSHTTRGNHVTPGIAFHLAGSPVTVGASPAGSADAVSVCGAR